MLKFMCILIQLLLFVFFCREKVNELINMFNNPLYPQPISVIMFVKKVLSIGWPGNTSFFFFFFTPITCYAYVQFPFFILQLVSYFEMDRSSKVTFACGHCIVFVTSQVQCCSCFPFPT